MGRRVQTSVIRREPKYLNAYPDDTYNPMGLYGRMFIWTSNDENYILKSTMYFPRFDFLRGAAVILDTPSASRYII